VSSDVLKRQVTPPRYNAEDVKLDSFAALLISASRLCPSMSLASRGSIRHVPKEALRRCFRLRVVYDGTMRKLSDSLVSPS